jgi:glycine/serine hydroxymethyltransferase
MFSFSPTNKYLKKLEQIESFNTKLLHLTANENVMSGLAMRFYCSSMGMRYDFGRGRDGVVDVDFFGNFAAITYPRMHDILDEAILKAKKLLHAEEMNLSCLSGAHAMLCALIGSTKPSDTIMTVREEDGGHFCTKKIIEITGRKHVYAIYDLAHLTFDVIKTIEAFRKYRAKVLYLDTSVLLQPHPLKELRNGLPKEAIIIYDASHTLGLIMGNEFQSPLLEGADIISANTHKTFPGPHKGLLAFRNKDIGNKINSVINNTLYSTVHTNSLLALAISIIEIDEFGEAYAKQIVKNSNAFGYALEDYGFKVRKVGSKYSYNHQVHMFIEGNCRDVVKRFLKNGMSINLSNALDGKLFIRFGTQELTKRGMFEKEMGQVAFFVKQILEGKNISKEVLGFNKLFPNVHYCFPYSFP